MQNRLAPTIRQLSHAYGVDAKFYSLWLDPYLTYSCANWDGCEDLETAQRLKLDAALDALKLPEGGSFLDVGCGWGSLLRRGAERGYKGMGLVPVAAQAAHCVQSGLDARESTWEGWQSVETFDALASIGAFEHFAARKASRAQRAEQYGHFFDWSAKRLRLGGRMYLQTICFLEESLADPAGLPFELVKPVVRLMRPVRMEWPNSMLPAGLWEILQAAAPRFEVASVRSRREDYARTCQTWLERLRARRTDAVTFVGEATVERFETYLASCAPTFDRGILTLYQIVLNKRPGLSAGSK